MTEQDVGLRQVQTLVQELLDELDRVCRAHGLSYFLAYGTLLGAVRDGGIIPWDVDADVWVLGEELDQLVEALRADVDPRFELLTPETHGDYEYLFPRLTLRGVHHVYLRVDLFPLDPAPGARRWWRGYITIAHLVCQVWFVKRADTGVRHHYSVRKRAAAHLLRLVARPVPERLLLWLFARLRRQGGSSDTLASSCGSYGLREFVPRAAFAAPVEASLGRSSHPVPGGAEQILADIYGTWQVPVDASRQAAELAAAERDFVGPLRAMGVIR